MTKNTAQAKFDTVTNALMDAHEKAARTKFIKRVVIGATIGAGILAAALLAEKHLENEPYED